MPGFNVIYVLYVPARHVVSPPICPAWGWRMPQGPSYVKSTLVQVMAWCHMCWSVPMLPASVKFRAGSPAHVGAVPGGAVSSGVAAPRGCTPFLLRVTGGLSGLAIWTIWSTQRACIWVDELEWLECGTVFCNDLFTHFRGWFPATNRRRGDRHTVNRNTQRILSALNRWRPFCTVVRCLLLALTQQCDTSSSTLSLTIYPEVSMGPLYQRSAFRNAKYVTYPAGLFR